VLFEKSIHEAIEICKKNESVSVELYVRDISNPAFVKTLENIKNNGLDPSLLVLEIRSDDYGILDLIAIRNLKLIAQL
jgi:EAL domain-containing protein (putative c-di-GMP-specific phosphodiesterase class I)